MKNKIRNTNLDPPSPKAMAGQELETNTNYRILNDQNWIPAFAGMTEVSAGMTEVSAGMTKWTRQWQNKNPAIVMAGLNGVVDNK